MQVREMSLHCNTPTVHTCVVLGGIPAPVYFGALIDSTCLKWSIKKCGGRGACRIYDADMYRYGRVGLNAVVLRL